MKIKLLSVTLLMTVSFVFSQNKNKFWETTSNTEKLILESSKQLPQKNLFKLEVNALKEYLSSSPQRNSLGKISNVIVSFPNDDGQLENFRIYENSIMDPALAARFPEIKSYIGIGIDNPTSIAYLVCHH